MSSKTVKFEINLEKLSVKFEGDVHTAERMQGEVTGALNMLASAQSKLLSAGQPSVTTAAPSIALEPRVTSRRRRRRRPTDGIDPSVLDGDFPSNGHGQAAEAAGDGHASPRRSAGGVVALLRNLKADGFF